MSIDVLFIRTRAVERENREWLEPVQICCAFDCRTSLLLLADATHGLAQLEDTLAELEELGISAVYALQAAVVPRVRAIDAEGVRALISQHTRVLHI